MEKYSIEKALRPGPRVENGSCDPDANKDYQDIAQYIKKEVCHSETPWSEDSPGPMIIAVALDSVADQPCVHSSTRNVEQHGIASSAGILAALSPMVRTSQMRIRGSPSSSVWLLPLSYKMPTYNVHHGRLTGAIQRRNTSSISTSATAPSSFSRRNELRTHEWGRLVYGRGFAKTRVHTRAMGNTQVGMRSWTFVASARMEFANTWDMS